MLRQQQLIQEQQLQAQRLEQQRIIQEQQRIQGKFHNQVSNSSSLDGYVDRHNSYVDRHNSYVDRHNHYINFWQRATGKLHELQPLISYLPYSLHHRAKAERTAEDSGAAEREEATECRRDRRWGWRRGGRGRWGGCDRGGAGRGEADRPGRRWPEKGRQKADPNQAGTSGATGWSLRFQRPLRFQWASVTELPSIQPLDVQSSNLFKVQMTLLKLEEYLWNSPQTLRSHLLS